MIRRLCLFFFAVWGAEVQAEHPIPRLPFVPRAYVCPRVDTAPVIDGRLDDAAWRLAPPTAPFVDIEGDLRPEPRFVTTARLAWDDSCLYVAAELEDLIERRLLSSADVMLIDIDALVWFFDTELGRRIRERRDHYRRGGPGSRQQEPARALQDGGLRSGGQQRNLL